MPETYTISGRCPVCGDQLFISRMECGNCHSALEGRFSLGRFQNLNAEQLQFLEVFIRCRGQNKAIQEMLNISYPTVTRKIDEIIIALGFESVELPPENAPATRREVLEMLSQNKISAAQANQLLAALKPSGE